jgi:uncharacterized cupredoxin-like copper-binding protein
MKKKRFVRLLALMCSAGMLTACAAAGPVAAPQSKQSAPVAKQEVKKEANVYKGKIVGVSRKARSISIKVGDKTQMVKFDDATTGMEFAKKGEAAIIQFKTMGNDQIATVIKPKLAKLPKGVTEIQPADVAKLIAMGPKKGKYFLVDARPEGRYKAGHIPTAVSIPVSKLKETKAALLPKNKKDIQLIFYCGGVT